MLDYNKLDKDIDDILKSFTAEDLRTWLALKLENENLERLAKGESVNITSENYKVSEISIINCLEAYIDVKSAGENSYALAA